MSPERLDVGELPEEAHARLIHLSNVFGRVLFDTARSPSPKGGESLPEAAHTDAAAVVDRTLYGALQVLDGVTPPIGNEDLRIEFVLNARVSERATGQVIDEIELGPNGEVSAWAFTGGLKGTSGRCPSDVGLQPSVESSGCFRACATQPRDPPSKLLVRRPGEWAEEACWPSP